MNEAAPDRESIGGVGALIDRLFRDGVDAGAQEAARLVEAARADAERILEAARAEADALLAAATAEAEQRRRAGEAALSIAARDTLIATREALFDLFEERLAEHVGQALERPDLLADLVRLAAAALVGPGPATVALAIPEDRAHALAALLADDLATGGILLEPVAEGPTIRARKDGSRITLELDRQRIAALLMAQLRPHLRGLFAGPERVA